MQTVCVMPRHHVSGVSSNTQWAFLVVLFASIKYLNMLETSSAKEYFSPASLAPCVQF